MQIMTQSPLKRGKYQKCQILYIKTWCRASIMCAHKDCRNVKHLRRACLKCCVVSNAQCSIWSNSSLSWIAVRNTSEFPECHCPLVSRHISMHTLHAWSAVLGRLLFWQIIHKSRQPERFELNLPSISHALPCWGELGNETWASQRAFSSCFPPRALIIQGQTRQSRCRVGWWPPVAQGLCDDILVSGRPLTRRS